MVNFRVDKKTHNTLNNQVEVIYSYMIGSAWKTHSVFFKDISTAEAFLERQARLWLLEALKKYVDHKRYIIERGKHQSQLPALDICTRNNAYFTSVSLSTIKRVFLDGYRWYCEILPSQNNHSYKSSLIDLLTLKDFCQKP